MKNLRSIVFFSLSIFVVCLFTPTTGQAQTGYNPVWNSTSYANNMIRDRIEARRRARIMASRKKSTGKIVSKKSKKKVVRRKSR